MLVPDLIGGSTHVDWARAAQNVVRAYCGWHVAPSITETIRVDGSGTNVLHLPSKKVTDITAFKVDGVDMLAAMEWSESGWVQWKSRGRLFVDRPRIVEVTLTHGFSVDEVPDVVALCAQIGRRASTAPAAVASQSVNGASVSYMTAGGAPLSVPLLGIEKDALAPYRLDWVI